MKNLLIAVLLLCPLAVVAEDYDYDNGSYWTVTGVDTEPGHFDDYMSDLSNVWSKSLKMMQDDGKVLSYKVFGNVNAREDEPDLWLMVEWKSAADMLDSPREYFDDNAEKLFGSMDKSKKAGEKRGKIRTIKGTSMLRELTFN
ncbi:MAG: hypothetical protein V7742_10215 [Halioglobus sp.]